MTGPTEKFDLWCIVELFGHSKIAGRCTEQSIAGGNLLRVDVPETTGQPAFTKFYGNAAIYAINPVDEQIARVMAESIQVKPVMPYNIHELLKKQTAIMAPPMPEDIEDRYNEQDVITEEDLITIANHVEVAPYMIDGEVIDVLDPRHPNSPF